MKRQQMVVTRRVQIITATFTCYNTETNELETVVKEFFNDKFPKHFDCYDVLKVLKTEVRYEMKSMSLEEFYHLAHDVEERGDDLE